MKYVYKNEKGLEVLSEYVGILELASIEDLIEEIKAINETLAKREANYQKWHNAPTYKLGYTFHNKLGVNPSDKLKCKEDVYVWDGKVNEYVSIEGYQAIDCPESWTEEERLAYIRIVQTWISAEDHSFDFHKFVREINEEIAEYIPIEKDEYTLKLDRLLCKELENGDDLEYFEYHYEKQKEEWKQYQQDREVEKMLEANVKGGIN